MLIPGSPILNPMATSIGSMFMWGTRPKASHVPQLAHIENVSMRRRLDRHYTDSSITARIAFERRGFEVITGQTVTVRGEAFVNYRWKSDSLCVFQDERADR